MNKLINKLNSQKGQSGFTIIEVLIVLAIGALIILAVLLAVPALQNNQKNSTRKSEASRVASAVTALISDNNAAQSAGLTKSDATQQTELQNRAGLGNGQLTTVVITDNAGIPTNLAANTAYVVIDKKCATATTLGTGSNAVIYATQPTSTTSKQGGCVDSRL